MLYMKKKGWKLLHFQISRYVENILKFFDKYLSLDLPSLNEGEVNEMYTTVYLYYPGNRRFVRAPGLHPFFLILS